MQDVSYSSSEQSTGVSQINKALSLVGEVTARNASAAEELSSTSEELASQAESLQQLMAFFRLPGSAGHVEVPPMPRVAASQPAQHVHPAVHAGGNGHDREPGDPNYVRF